MRRLIAFPCQGETLAATLDEAAGTTGVMIVSGGSEVREGTHRGMAMLALSLAAGGVPVWRYDRRGVGDSTGVDRGFRSSAPDMAAAAAAFRAHMPQMTQVMGFGNCDAASALALFGRAAGIDRVVLANPWVVEPIDDLPPATAIRARYAAALRDRATWHRALSGGIDFGKFIRGLWRIAGKRSEQPDRLAEQVIAAIAAWDTDARIVLAARDATAIAFADASRHAGLTPYRIDTASHSFFGEAAALEAAIRRSLG